MCRVGGLYKIIRVQFAGLLPELEENPTTQAYEIPTQLQHKVQELEMKAYAQRESFNNATWHRAMLIVWHLLASIGIKNQNISKYLLHFELFLRWGVVRCVGAWAEQRMINTKYIIFCSICCPLSAILTHLQTIFQCQMPDLRCCCTWRCAALSMSLGCVFSYSPWFKF